MEDHNFTNELKKLEDGISPGQACVFYSQDKQGCKVLGGLDMLIAQARPSFELFYNQEPPRNLNVRKKLIKALDGRL